MPSTKYEVLSYPTRFLKSRGSIIRNIFLKGRAKKPQLLHDENIIMHCSLQIKQNIHLIGILSSCSDTIYSKTIKQNRNKKCHRNVTNYPKGIGQA